MLVQQIEQVFLNSRERWEARMSLRALNAAVVTFAVFVLSGNIRGAAPTTSPSASQLIAVGDRLLIQLKNDALVPNTELKNFGIHPFVDDNGNIDSYGLKPPVHVAGLSCDEAASAINLAYRQSVPSREVDAKIQVNTPPNCDACSRG
jgi:protein involved in polysaccharide export with SLBB domain